MAVPVDHHVTEDGDSKVTHPVPSEQDYADEMEASAHPWVSKSVPGRLEKDKDCNVENLGGAITDYCEVQACPLLAADDGGGPDVDGDSDDKNGGVCHGLAG